MFYERLSILCEANNTSVAEVAKNILKVSSGTPTGWKNGTSPKLSVLITAAKYFDVSTDYLLGLSDMPSASSECAELSPDEWQIIRALRNADPRNRVAAVLSMNAILGISESTIKESCDQQATFSHLDVGNKDARSAV